MNSIGQLNSFKHSFAPAKNAEGRGMLTFLGWEHSVPANYPTGDQKFLKLIFKCLGASGEDANLAILSSYKIGENVFTRTIQKMGIEIPKPKMAKNSLGFQVMESPEASLNQIYDELESLMGTCWTALLTQIEEGRAKGLWRIEVDSLLPLMIKGSQHREEIDADGEIQIDGEVPAED